MTVSDLVQQLRSHANLPRSPAPSNGLVRAVRRWRKEGDALAIGSQMVEIVQALQGINAHCLILGVLRLQDGAFHDAAYPTSCLIAELATAIREKRRVDDVGAKRTLEWALEVIAHAWAQLLAGDIEDLIQDLADNGLWPADVPTG